MKKEIAITMNSTNCITQNVKKHLIILSAFMLGSTLFSVPAYASGNERHERYEYEGREHYREESKVYGVIEKMPEQGYNGTWVVSGHQVLVTDATRIKEKYGRAAVGKPAEIEGVRTGEIIKAFEVEIERGREERVDDDRRPDDRRGDSKFYGTVETLPQTGLNGVWKVDGREIVVTSNTRIKEKYGRLAVGSLVEVEGRFADNAFTAHEIEVKTRR